MYFRHPSRDTKRFTTTGLNRTPKFPQHKTPKINPNLQFLDQLKSIQDYKLANFICDNSDISSTLKDSFISSGISVDCQSLPSIDLTFWEDFNNKTGGE